LPRNTVLPPAVEFHQNDVSSSPYRFFKNFFLSLSIQKEGLKRQAKALEIYYQNRLVTISRKQIYQS